MIRIRKSADRGHARFGWLESRHTFSFGSYRDPRHMGFRGLRVINEDRVQPGRGFDPHDHRDMEILSWVVEGALAHRDSLGNGSVIRPGELQRMSAGTGVTHSEFEASGTAPVHFLQIWILPERMDLAPSYEQRAFEEGERRGRLQRLASRDGREGSVALHADAAVYAASLAPGETVTHSLAPGRGAWVQGIGGEVEVDGTTLQAGDGASVEDAPSLTLVGRRPAELLLFDLA